LGTSQFDYIKGEALKCYNNVRYILLSRREMAKKRVTKKTGRKEQKKSSEYLRKGSKKR
jgi:hypothetical protein